MIICQDTMLTMEQGDHSSLGYDGPFMALQEFDQATVVEAFRDQWTPKHAYQDVPDHDEFIAWLIKEGLIADVKCTARWHLGYSWEFSPEID